MSDINPDFSFPSLAPQSAPILPPPPIHSNRPLSFSPQSRPRKHAHRRSAAMSEDLSAVELASLTTPPTTTPPMAAFSKPVTPSTSGPRSSPKSASPPLALSTPTSADGASPRRNSFDSRFHVQFISSPLPKRQHQIGEPGKLIANADAKSSSSSASPSSLLLKPEQGSEHRSELRSEHRSEHKSEHKSEHREHKSDHRPDHVDLHAPEHRRSGSSSLTADNDAESAERADKRRKRRSFVQLFKRSSEPDDSQRSSSRQAPHSPGRHQRRSSTDVHSYGTNHASISPPESPHGDETLVPSSHLYSSQTYVPALPPSQSSAVQQPSAFRTPVTQQTTQFFGSPIATPRSSGELSRDNEPLPPTIDLDEALSCSFNHRKQDSVLESPFSKTSSAMDAVLEEEEDEREESESDSLSSIHKRRQRPSSILHKTNSVSSTGSSIRLKTPASPRFAPVVANSTPTSAGTGGRRTISYVGPVLHPPSPSASPPRSPRFSFEQVSNLAISDPNPAVAVATSKHLSMPPPASPAKKGHQRRRSLIDKLMRR